MQTTSRQPENKTVAVYVVTAGDTPFLSQTLRAVIKNTFPFHSLTLVNTTADQITAATLAIGQQHPGFQVLNLPEVKDLGEALNQALARSRQQSDYLWILSDHSAPAEDCLAALYECGENDENAPIVGGKSFSWNNPSQLIATGISATKTGRFHYPLAPDEIDQGQYDSLRDVLAVYLTGALVRTQWWHKLRGSLNFLDVQAASLDFCQRTYLAGKHVVFAPKARLYVAGAEAIRLEKSVFKAENAAAAAEQSVKESGQDGAAAEPESENAAEKATELESKIAAPCAAEPETANAVKKASEPENKVAAGRAEVRETLEESAPSDVEAAASQVETLAASPSETLPTETRAAETPAETVTTEIPAAETPAAAIAAETALSRAENQETPRETELAADAKLAADTELAADIELAADAETGREGLFAAGLKASEPFNLLKTQVVQERHSALLDNSANLAPQDHQRLRKDIPVPVQETWIGPDSEVHPRLLEQLRPNALQKRQNELMLRALNAPRYTWVLALGYYFLLALGGSLGLLGSKQVRAALRELAAYFVLWRNAGALLKARRERYAQAKRSARVMQGLFTPVRQWRETRRVARKMRRDQDNLELGLEALVQKQLYQRRDRDRVALMSLFFVALLLSLVLWYVNRSGINGGYWSFLPDKWADLGSAATTWWLPGSVGRAGVPDPILMVLTIMSAPLGLLGLSPNWLSLGLLNFAPLLALGSAWLSSSTLSRTTSMRTWLSLMWLASPLLWLGILYGDLNAVLWQVFFPLAWWASMRVLALGEAYRFAGVNQICEYRPGGSGGMYAGIAALCWLVVAAVSPFSLGIVTILAAPVIGGAWWNWGRLNRRTDPEVKTVTPSLDRGQKIARSFGFVLSLVPAWLLLLPGIAEISFTRLKVLPQLYAYALQVPAHSDQPTIAQVGAVLVRDAKGLAGFLALLFAALILAALAALGRGRRYVSLSFLLVVLALGAAATCLGISTTWPLIPMQLSYAALLSMIALGLDYLASGWRYRDYHNLRGSLRLALQQDSFYQYRKLKAGAFLKSEAASGENSTAETAIMEANTATAKTATEPAADLEAVSWAAGEARELESIPTDYTEESYPANPELNLEGTKPEFTSAKLARYRFYLGVRYLGMIGAFLMPLGFLAAATPPVLAYNSLHGQSVTKLGENPASLEAAELKGGLNPGKSAELKSADPAGESAAQNRWNSAASANLSDPSTAAKEPVQALAFLPQGARPGTSKLPGTYRIFSQDIPRSRAILIEKQAGGSGYKISLWRFPAQSGLGSNALTRAEQALNWNKAQLAIADLGVELISGNIGAFNEKALALGAEQVYLERAADPDGQISLALEGDPYLYEVKQSGNYSQWQIDPKSANNRYLPARFTITEPGRAGQILESALLSASDQIGPSEKSRQVRLLEQDSPYWQLRLDGKLLNKTAQDFVQEFQVPAGASGELILKYVRPETRYWLVAFFCTFTVAILLALPLGGRRNHV